MPFDERQDKRAARMRARWKGRKEGSGSLPPSSRLTDEERVIVAEHKALLREIETRLSQRKEERAVAAVVSVTSEHLTEVKRLYRKLRYERLKAEGVCVECGKEQKERGLRCQDCALNNSTRARKSQLIKEQEVAP